MKRNILKNYSKNDLSRLLVNSIAYSSEASKQIPKSYHEIPGPKCYPPKLNVENFLQDHLNKGGELDPTNLSEFFKTLNEKYGDLVKLNYFGRTQIFMLNPELFKRVHQIDGLTPARKPVRPWVSYYEHRKVPVPLFSSQGERWRKLRSAANPLAARPQTIHSYIEKHGEVADDFIQYLNNKFPDAASKETIVTDFQKLLHLLSLEMLSVITLDSRIRCVEEKHRTPEITKLIDSLVNFMLFTHQLLIKIPIWKYYETKDRKEFFENFDYIYKMMSNYINEVLARVSKETVNEKSILQQLVMNKEKNNLSMEDITAIMIDLLMAGVDTTATSLHYILYELGRNKDVQKKLHDEILRSIGNEKNITADMLANMKLLKAVVKEAQRLHGVLPIYGRVLQEDIVLNGYLIPKKTCVNLCITHTSRSEKYFKDALKFNPERWLNDESIDPYASLPFGYGVRMCIGRRVSEQEMYLIVSKLIQNYEIEYTGKTTNYKFGILAVPDQPLNLRLTKRS